jgi:hypothetical protein
MRRLGTPADIGNAVTLLCSKEAGFITGQLLAVDGGASLMDPPHCRWPFSSRNSSPRRGFRILECRFKISDWDGEN